MLLRPFSITKLMWNYQITMVKVHFSWLVGKVCKRILFKDNCFICDLIMNKFFLLLCRSQRRCRTFTSTIGVSGLSHKDRYHTFVSSLSRESYIHS